MITTNDVYRKIKEISLRSANPRPQVMIQLVAYELKCVREQIQSALQELQQMRLIQIDNSGNVKLTLLGSTVTR